VSWRRIAEEILPFAYGALGGAIGSVLALLAVARWS
jgi:hypothetical protein